MNSRQKLLLQSIIKEYVSSSCPVGSKLLESKTNLGVSSATIRNEMAELEKAGYIIQPHTSAGRIPTEKGFKYYLAELNFQGQLKSKEILYLNKILETVKDQNFTVEQTVKSLAKAMAEISHNAVIAAFGPQNIYYTGFSSLFNQPEFSNMNFVASMGLIIDHLDQVVSEIYYQTQEVQVKVGRENPFAHDCGLVMGPWKYQSENGMMAILGPIRMNYEKNLGLINFLAN